MGFLTLASSQGPNELANILLRVEIRSPPSMCCLSPYECRCHGVDHGDVQTWKVSDATDLETMIGRETKHHFLCTTSQRIRDDYAPMLACLKEAYPDDEFTPALRALYEIAKNVPGYLGMWIEAKAMHERCKRRSRDVRSIMNIETLFVSVLCVKLLDNPRLFTDYWRAVVNRQDDVKRSRKFCLMTFSLLWRVLVPFFPDR